MTKTTTLMVGAALIAAVAVGVGGSAAADSSSHPKSKTVHVHFLPTGIVANDLGHVCDNGGIQCVYSSSETDVTQTGDLRGSTVQADVTSAGSSTTVVRLSEGTFTGWVNGCGTGSFLYSGRGTFDYAADVADSTFVIDAGSGTGDLVGISGVFTQRGTVSGTETPPLNGSVRCAVGH